jgi:hypothetical protein
MHIHLIYIYEILKAALSIDRCMFFKICCYAIDDPIIPPVDREPLTG